MISKGSSTLNGVAGKCNKTDQGPLLSCLLRWRECKGERVECALSRFYQQGETFIFGLPTKYDVLCDPSDSYSDHIGNCCFRIVAAMWLPRYIELKNGGFLSYDVNSEESRVLLMAEFMQSLSTCNPPSRFLALDTTVGRWQPLSDAYVVQKIDATLRTIAIILISRGQN